MRYLLLFLFYLLVGLESVCFSQTVSIVWSNKPQTKHHFYAIEADDSASISFQGVGTCMAAIKPTSARVIIYKDNVPIDTVVQAITFTGNTTQISFSARIKGTIASFKTVFQVGNTNAISDSIKAGIVILCNGQSNMVAGYPQTLVSTTIPLDPYISSYGSSVFSNPVSATTPAALRFFLANPNSAYSYGSIGLGAFYMAKVIKDSLQLPICVINGAKGGTTIAEHLKKWLPNINQDSLTFYGRLLLRVKKAGFQARHIRAFFWYQGESDVNTSLAQYSSSFNELKDSLKKDYGQNLPFFVVQIRRECCSANLYNVLGLQELQRNLINTANVKGVMSVNGLETNSIDYCHFNVNSYKKIGTQLGKMFCAYLRGINTNLLFPQPVSAQLIPGNNLIKLLVSAPIDTTKLNNCKKFFRLSDGINIFPLSALTSNQDTIFLHFASPLPNNAYFLSYIGSLMQDTSAVFAKTGGALLCFHQFIVSTNGQFNGTSNIPCVGTPTVGNIIANNSTLCANQGTILTLSGSAMTTGITRQWKYASNPLGPYLNIPNSASTLTQNTGNLSSNTYYVVTLTCSNSGDSATTPVETINVNPLPIITCLQSSNIICNSNIPISLTAAGANSYKWFPPNGLSDTIGTIISANPSYSTTYTILGTNSFGCIGTTTTDVLVNKPNIWASANPTIICPNANTQLYVTDSTSILQIPPANYPPSSANSSSDEDIINVTLTGYLDNTSVCGTLAPGLGSFASRYSNYTTLSPPAILAGTTINGTIKIKSCGTFAYSTGFAIFIDYNRNGKFELPNERVVAQGIATSSLLGGTTRAFSFTIPPSAFKGVTLMRVVAVESTSGVNGGISPIGTYMWGETEDYLLNITRVNPSTGYSWAPSTIPTSGNIVTTPNINTSTNYTVIGTDIMGCSDTTSVLVNVTNTLSLSPTTSTVICANEPFMLYANAIGASTMTYSWSNNGGNTANISLTKPAGTYTYNVFVSNNCSVTVIDTITFTVQASPTIMVTPDTSSICNPVITYAMLNASGASTYSWTASSSQNIYTGTPLFLNPNITTTYTIIGIDYWGCKDTTKALVYVGQYITANAQAMPNVICPHDSVLLTASSIVTPYTNYCPHFHANGCFGDNISQVSLNTLNNASGTGCGGASQYTYFNGGGTQTTQLIAGNTYVLSTTFGPDPYQYCAAWIDYNQNNDFSGVDFLGASTINAGANGTSIISFTVPINALNGTTRLRIVGGNDNPIAAYACANNAYTYGETEDYDITIINGQVPSIQYNWSPSIFLDTTIGNLVNAMNVTNPITYTLIATSSQGCQSTDSAEISFYPITPANAGQSVNMNAIDCNTDIPLSSSGVGLWSGGNGIFSDINNPFSTYTPTLSEYNTNITLTWTTNTGACPSSDTMQVNILSPNPFFSTTVAPTNDSIYNADYELIVGNWTSYFNNNNTPPNQCDDYILLSVRDANTNGNAIGHVGDLGFDMTLHALNGNNQLSYPNTPYVDNGATWYPMNRYWELTPLQQPTNDVHVKYYFKSADIDALQSIFPAASPNDAKIYTINNDNPNTTYFDLSPINSHLGIPLATPYNYQGYGYWEYYSGATPSATTWSLGNVGSDYSAEILTARLTGGGAGMGSRLLILPADILSFKGYSMGDENELEWVSEAELNCKEFRLMKSADKLNYTHLATLKTKAINGTNHDTLHYAATDPNPLQITYYQLIQIDINGQEKSSEVIQVNKNTEALFWGTIYPNPTESDLNINLYMSTLTDCNVQIVDMAGKIVATTAPESFEEGFNTIWIKVGHLAKGVYVAKVKNLTYGGTHNLKFVKK